MLLSMTGFGDARLEQPDRTLAVEVRSVNNRYLKVATKLPERYAALEGDVEKVVRNTVSRGMVSVSIRLGRKGTDQGYRLNREAITQYFNDATELAKTLNPDTAIDINQLLTLPGVVAEEENATDDPRDDWKMLETALVEALEKLTTFRAAEGASMQRELSGGCAAIEAELEKIVAIAPQVVSEYREKIVERVTALLAETDARVMPNDLIRDVSIFADRADINEEITRLRCHIEQFESFLDQPNSTGRKLDFLIQEMFREINTIGSKANNVEIAHAVVEMKSIVEKQREILQNVE